ncbi:MAG TPA: NAD(P)-dependent oxidoreductase [Stellaceae bacterium]|jgi:siroheme synthase-like protein|nr:NAD(P)-dependent oxidoreductase [Stellaceae bacterium]
MLPLSLDLARLNLVLIGNGESCLRRLRLLNEAGARSLAVFSAAPSPALAREAGRQLHRHWPKRDELRGAQFVFIADVAEPQRTALAGLARSVGAILHVEDAPALTDSHAPAVLRRGALTVAVATDGTAPGVAAELRDFLAGLIGPEWRGRLHRIATQRRKWRDAGVDHATVRRLTAAQLGRYGWPVAVAANDRDAETKEPSGGGKS